VPRWTRSGSAASASRWVARGDRVKAVVVG
jgi:hypothetical protein